MKKKDTAYWTSEKVMKARSKALKYLSVKDFDRFIRRFGSKKMKAFWFTMHDLQKYLTMVEIILCEPSEETKDLECYCRCALNLSEAVKNRMEAERGNDDTGSTKNNPGNDQFEP